MLKSGWFQFFYLANWGSDFNLGMDRQIVLIPVFLFSSWWCFPKKNPLGSSTQFPLAREGFQVGLQCWMMNCTVHDEHELPPVSQTMSRKDTSLGTNMSHSKALLKMIFLFPRRDMLIPWGGNWSFCSISHCVCGTLPSSIDPAIPQENQRRTWKDRPGNDYGKFKWIE